MSPILEVKNLTSQIQRQGNPLIHKLSLTLKNQDRLILSGPSGIGKSVLLRTLVFLDPLKEGDIYFQGNKITAEQVPRFRSQVVYLGQKPSLSEGTVEDNFKKAFEFKTHKELVYSREKVIPILELFKLGETFLNQQAKLLSGGEAQIMALIRALIIEPKVLLLDEPTASIDVLKTEIFEKHIVDWIASSQERALIWITHQKAQENRIGTRVLDLSPKY
ncbi:MAG: ATP-binding cassette domain-containing protein [Deltaproteobacteria bacterium]